MKKIISTFWWPIMGLASPVLIPFLLKKNYSYQKNVSKAEKLNKMRIDNAESFPIPEVESLKLTTLVEWKQKDGFFGDAGVSYLLNTNLGSMLFDIGHGADNQTLLKNIERLNLDLNDIDALTISHLHKDHMGGLKAARDKIVRLPEQLMPAELKTCYLPDSAGTEGFKTNLVDSPTILESGIASTGPLARSLFFLGFTEEQALIINIKDKGLAIITGCGHPTIKTILKMVKKISDQTIYAIGGGLHFPLTEGRGSKFGFELQQVFGTGKAPWDKITKKDLEETIETINNCGAKKVFLSAHDSCDFSLSYLKENLKAETEILKAGESYHI